MAIDKNDLADALFVAEQIFRGATIRQICHQLKCSKTKVVSLLEEAKDLIELRFSVPSEFSLAAKLRSKFGLLDAVVVETRELDIGRSIVGEAAAMYFLENVGQTDAVGFGAGGTLFEMARALPRLRDNDNSISMLTVEANPEFVHEAPSTIVGIVRSRLGSGDVYGVALPPIETTESLDERRRWKGSMSFKRLRKRALGCKFYFLGVGSPCQSVNCGNNYFQMADQATGGQFGKLINDYSLVGEVSNLVFDAKGHDRTDDIPDLEKVFLDLITLDELRAASVIRSVEDADEQRYVVGVATGEEKAEAIRIALETKIFNVMITGVADAERLLATPETENKNNTQQE